VSKLKLANMTIMAKWHVLNNGIHYFQISVPKTLTDRLGKRLIRKRVSQVPVEAISECEKLGKAHTAFFKGLRLNSELTDHESLLAAKALLSSYSLSPGDGTKEVTLVNQTKASIQSGPNAQPHLDAFLEEQLGESHEWSKTAIMAHTLLYKNIPLSLSRFFDAYVQNHVKRENTDFVSSQRQHWNKLIELFGDVALQDLTREQAHEYINHRRSKNIRTTSILRELNSINAVINGAKKELDIDFRNVFSSITIPNYGSDSVRRNTASKEQTLAVLRAALTKQDDIRAILILLIFTGARIGEIVGLKRTDIDLKNNYVSIIPTDIRSTKSNASRDTPLHPIAVETIRRHLLTHDSDIVFPRYYSSNHTKVAATSASAALAKWIRTLTEGITSHSFRHAARDRYRDIECPDEIAEAIVGWKTKLDTSERYGDGYSMTIKRRWMNKAWAWLAYKIDSSGIIRIQD